MNAKQTTRTKQAEAAVVPPVETGMGPTPEQVAQARAILAALPKGPAPEILAAYTALKTKHEAELKAFHEAHPEVKGNRKGPGQRSPEANAETTRFKNLAGNPSKIQSHQVWGKKTYESKNYAELNKIMPVELFQECLKAGMTATEFMAARAKS